MEHTQAKQQFLEHTQSIVDVKEVLVTYRFHFVTANHVGFQTFRGLVSHLDAVLEDQYREVFARVGGQPETERGVRHILGAHFHVQTLTDAL